MIIIINDCWLVCWKSKFEEFSLDWKYVFLERHLSICKRLLKLEFLALIVSLCFLFLHLVNNRLLENCIKLKSSGYSRQIYFLKNSKVRKTKGP